MYLLSNCFIFTLERRGFQSIQTFTGVSLRATHRTMWPAVRAILLSWFDHLGESFSNKEVQFLTISLPWSQRFFLIFLRESYKRAVKRWKHELRSGKKEKSLVTLDLNLTFMQTPGSGSDPRARIGWYFYKHANQYDWFVWLVTPRGRWGYLSLHFLR